MAVKADIDFQKDLFDAATRMRGSITPSDYKHYVLPLIFLRYVSLRFDKRRAQVEEMVNDKESIWYSDDQEVRENILNDPDQYKSENVFMIPEEARWSYIVEKANDSNIKGILDNAMKLIEQENPELEGILPRIFQGSNLPAENVAGLIEIFSRDIFSARHV